MITTVSASTAHAAETLSTLQYAKRAQAIVNISVQGTIAVEERGDLERLEEKLREQKRASEETASLARTKLSALRQEVEDLRRKREREGEIEAQLAQHRWRVLALRHRAERREGEVAQLRDDLKIVVQQAKRKTSEQLRARLERAEARAEAAEARAEAAEARAEAAARMEGELAVRIP